MGACFLVVILGAMGAVVWSVVSDAPGDPLHSEDPAFRCICAPKQPFALTHLLLPNTAARQLTFIHSGHTEESSAGVVPAAAAAAASIAAAHAATAAAARAANATKAESPWDWIRGVAAAGGQQ